MAEIAKTTRAVVLARGLGRRMRDHLASGGGPLAAAQAASADAGLKGMIPFGSRPFLDFVLHSLAEAGVRRAGLVIGPEHDEVRHYYEQLHPERIQISFVTQGQPLGTADAVAAAAAWTGGDPFLTVNADNLYPADVLSRLTSGTTPALPGFERDSLNLPLERIGAFALLECDSRGCLSRIVEKPGRDMVAAAGPAALISMNVWRFDARIFDACREVPLSPRGERELPLAVALAAARGVCFEVFTACGEVLDLSSRSDIAHVASRLEGTRVEL